MSKIALISGITGQDGSYLAEFLLKKGYTVFGLMPHRNNPHLGNIEHIKDHIELVPGDMLDGTSLRAAIKHSQPDEVYNLAAQSFVAKSWQLPTLTKMVNYVGFEQLLEACRDINPGIKIYQASTSEMFGSAPAPQNEKTPFSPNSPYAVTKTAAHLTAVNFRESYDMFIACGILFNHESERRGEHFVTQKIAKAVARIKHGFQSTISLGNLDAMRDWGYAPDYVEAMWLMLQQEKPDDFVIGTGVRHSVQDFLNAACRYVGIEDVSKHLVIDPQLLRPVDVPELCADTTKAKQILKWKAKTTFDQLVAKMVDHWQNQITAPVQALSGLHDKFRYAGRDYDYFTMIGTQPGPNTYEEDSIRDNELRVVASIAMEFRKQFQPHDVLEIGTLTRIFDEEASHPYLGSPGQSCGKDLPGWIDADVQDWIPERNYAAIVWPTGLQKAHNKHELLRRVLDWADNAFISIPLGYPIEPEDAILNTTNLVVASRWPDVQLSYMKRVSQSNRWVQTTWDDVKDTVYGEPYAAANAVAIWTKKSPT